MVISKKILLSILIGLVAFYIIYFVEWLIRCAINKFKLDNAAYRNISFEREAYGNQENSNYLKERKLFSWLKYL